jgi:hypothetical protein
MVKNAITPQSFPSASMENPPKPSGIKRETSEEYRWQQPLIVHAMGGKDVVDSLRRIDPQRISEIISDAENRLHGYAVLAGNSPEPSESVETEVAKIVAAGETIEDFDPTEL